MSARKKKPERRAYHSTLRQKQASFTRQSIVEALAEQVCESGRADFSVAEVAARAEVSERTVYRHFPTRDDLIEGLDEYLEGLEGADLPRDGETLRAHMRRVVRFFEDNAALIEAGHLTQIGREVRQRGRERRRAAIRETMDAWLAPLPARERRRAYAAFATMFGSATWRAMRRELGLGRAETAETMQWVVDLVVDDLSRRVRDAEDP
ncbi:MAG: TetR/AcrR family transcriptional regulator [Sandaracinaceae bacterium]